MSAGSRTYGVCSAPSDDLAKTNEVFVSSDDPLARAGTVTINGFPFNVRGNEKIPPGQCGFNAIQRRCLQVTTTGGSSVVLTPLPPGRVPIANQITLQVEHIMPSKRGGSIDCEAFGAAFKRLFAGQLFRPQQQLALMMDELALRLVGTVVAVVADGGKSDVGSVDPANTMILVRAEPRSEITLTNLSDAQVDAQQTQLVKDFKLEDLGIGGLSNEFGQVFRRAFASRTFPPSYIKKLGIKHVKGVLLYGPPGTGKTLIARKIGEILNCHPPKIVNGPEVFNKYVGGTEENIRKLFAEAEAEQAESENSKLHLIIFDEFDAICKQRGAVRDSTGVNDNVVNQLLSKIDGVNSLNNVLLIGMTNRLDLIDEAILRPGRFEVHIEIGLPDEAGRVEIFRIHTSKIREAGALDPGVNLEYLASKTKNYSGAEIEGVVRAATSNAFNRKIDMDNLSKQIDPRDIRITPQDFETAIAEVTPAFGQASEECEALMAGDIINYGRSWEALDARCMHVVQQLTAEGKRIQRLSVLVEGLPGCGKSAVAAYMAKKADFPYVKVISNDNMVGYGELQKVNIIRKAFEDAYKSPQSCIILDDLERLIEFSQLGGRYSNALLQALLVLVKRQPPEGKRLLVIGTTSQKDIMASLELSDCFSAHMHITGVPSADLATVAQNMKLRFALATDLDKARRMMPSTLPIKQLMLVLDMAAADAIITEKSFQLALQSMGIAGDDGADLGGAGGGGYGGNYGY